MKFSIITVSFNASRSIKETLDSVVLQTYPNVEHIVVDGESVDGTVRIVEKYRDNGVRLISEPDNGIYDAMNKGLRLATGDIVGFLNADDRYPHADILSMVSTIFENEDVDAVFGDVEYFNTGNFARPIRKYSSKHFKPERISWGWMPAHPTLFMKSDIYKRFGEFKTDYKIAGDFELVARIFSGRDIRYRYIPEVIVEMRTGGVSTGGWKNTVLLNREVLRACAENGLSTNIFKLLSKYPMKMLEFIKK